MGGASEVVFVDLADEVVDESAEHAAGAVVVDEGCDDVEGVGSGAEPFEVNVAGCCGCGDAGVDPGPDDVGGG